jgi:hypothetical protein
MQPLQIANKVSRMLSLLNRIWREHHRLRERVRIMETDLQMTNDDLARLYRRVESVERTDSRMRQATY